MEGMLKSDIFFFVTTIAVVVISIGLLIAVFYLIKILKDIRHISDKVKEESDEIIKDVKSLREGVKKEGLRFKDVSLFFINLFRSKKKSGGNKRKKKKDES